MDQLQCIRNFVSVVEAGGFAGASRKLGTSPASVTRAISELESLLGVSLLTRTTRVTRVTDAGARYFDDCKRILADLDQANSSAAGTHGTPRGQVTITASSMFGNMYVAPLVTEYLNTYPETQALCLFVDRVVNIDEEGVDIAVRIGELPDSSLQAARVGSVRKMLVASPEYLSRGGVLQHPRDLTAHKVISATGLTPSPHWRFVEGGQPLVCEVRPTLMTTTNDSAITAAVSGFGIARLLSYQVAEHLRAGLLTTVLAEFETAPSPVNVLHRQGRRPNAKVRALLDLLIERLSLEKSLSQAG